MVYNPCFALLNLINQGLLSAESIGYNPAQLLAIPVMMLWISAKLPGACQTAFEPNR